MTRNAAITAASAGSNPTSPSYPMIRRNRYGRSSRPVGLTDREQLRSADGRPVTVRSIEILVHERWYTIVFGPVEAEFVCAKNGDTLVNLYDSRTRTVLRRVRVPKASRAK